MSKTIKIFTSPTCSNCPPAKALGEELMKRNQSVEMLSIAEAEGLAESRMHSVMAVPSIVIVDENDNEIAAWRSEMPSIEEIIEKIK